MRGSKRWAEKRVLNPTILLKKSLFIGDRKQNPYLSESTQIYDSHALYEN